jgi:hypothetical protein
MERRHNPVFRSLNRPLNLMGAERVARTSAFEVRGLSMGWGKKPQTWKAQVCATRSSSSPS